MIDKLHKILSFYNINAKSIINQNEDNDVFKATDNKGESYLLKIYKKNNNYDIIPGENIYHTYKQIQIESEILYLLADSALGTAVPIKNKSGEFVTVFEPDAEGESENKYATVTSFIDGARLEDSQAPSLEMAYFAGVAAARFHLESEKRLLSAAVKRPHKRQDYIQKIRNRLLHGRETGTLTDAQFEMLSQCCDVVLDCMNKLDKDMRYNVGLVHTDIRNTNFIYTPDQNHVILIDFSRSVYSYYLYDLGEMCLHGSFGGSSPDLQNAILRGYHSVKPLKKEHPFMMQALFAMFIMTVMAESIDSPQNTWLSNVLKWFEEEVHPRLISGKGYLDSSVFENICMI